MTNREAIKGLERLAKEFSGYEPNEEMFEMAIKALTKEAWKEEHPVSPLLQKPALTAQPERIQNNAVHLCDSCQYTYVTCPSHGNDAVFGDGKGNDNICACNKYRPISAQPEPSQMARDIATIIENEKDMRVIAQPETHEKRTETHSCDCISRQAAIDAHYEYCNKHPDAGFPVWSLKILEDLPSAQPEIIRCKDCIFHGLCRTSTIWAVAPKDDWFCADAKRRTDE